MVSEVPDDLERVIDKYAGTPFCDLDAFTQSEYLGALSKRGAIDVLKAIGLSDADAAADIKDIRDLLRGFRVVRNRAWSTIFNAFGRILGWFIILAIGGLMVKSESAKQLFKLFE